MGFQSMLRERVKKWPQQWMEEGAKKGRQEGRREGRRQGRREAQREILLALLAQKFGELPKERCGEVSAANNKSLLKWTTRVLTSDTVEQVFR